MWIRRLEVVDCAGIAEASVDLRPGLNVLHGPNELGKSTLAEAVRAVLLLQSGSSAAGVLNDWHGDAPPRVALTFEQEDQRLWRVRKTFKVGGGQSLLEFSRDGRDFRTESRGREVDGRLTDMLGWGARKPGGRGGPRGMPSTLITTALLGRQDEVTGILERSLTDDPTDSGREQLMRALEGLAEDPRLKKLLLAVQGKVDEAYTATGRRRSGRTSPWTQLRQERLAAEERQQEVLAQREQSQRVHLRVKELQQEQTAAETVAATAARTLDAARAAAAWLGEVEQARTGLRAAEEELARIEKAMRTRGEKLAAAEEVRRRIGSLSGRHAELEREVDRLDAQLEVARQRVREVETGGDEQGRRLREQEAENERIEIVRRQEEFDRLVSDAKRFLELDREIGALDFGIEQKEERLSRTRALIVVAEQAGESDRRRLGDLRVESLTARCLAACRKVKRLARQVEEAQQNAAAAKAAEEEAASLRRAAVDLRAPDAEQIRRLHRLETESRIAQERLAVGLVVDLEILAGAMAEVRADGADPVQAGEDRHAEFEARRALRIDIPGFGRVQVRGGGRELAAAADAADLALDAVRRPLLEQAGVASVAELEAVRRRADSLLAAAEERRRSAVEARVRAEGIEALGRDEALARGDLDRARRTLAEALGEGASVEEHVRDLEVQPREDAVVSAEIAEVEKRISEGAERLRRLQARVKQDDLDLVRERRQREAGKVELQRADFDWRGLLAGEDKRGAELARNLEAAESRLEAIRAEAALEADEARGQALNVEQRRAAARAERDEARRERSSQGEALAGLESGIRVHEEALERVDVETARREVQRSRELVAALESDPVPADGAGADVEELERTFEEARRKVARISEDLLVSRGALQQVRGADAEEQAVDAREAVEAVREREASLEVDYEGWKLLAETLREVEKQETAHLGKALVQPVTSRVSALTGGRYGDLAIGPDLDVAGIRFAGAERGFRELSVGAREQIAMLLRISIAEVLGAFVVLDDQLTQTDESRMAWLRDLLEEAAARIQIVVLTCHPRDYGSSPGAHVVDLASRVRRSGPNGGAVTP